MPPNFKLIGPLLPEPARPLPADLEVGSPLIHTYANRTGQKDLPVLAGMMYAPARICPAAAR